MRVLLFAVVAALAFALPADAAWPCTTSQPEHDTGETPIGRYYHDQDCFVMDPCMTPEPWGIWVYQESNGIDGLQRRDQLHDDTDRGRCYPADTMIF